MKYVYGEGILVAILLPIALYFFGILKDIQAFSFLLLLVGLWSVGFGLAFAERNDRLYYGGWGVVVALASTFYLIPLQYTLGLIIIAVIAIIVLIGATRRRSART